MAIRSRSHTHLFAVAAARLEQDHANPKLVADLRSLVKRETDRRVEGRTASPEEEARIDAQRTAFNMVHNGPQKAALLASMQQRAYDLLWDGDGLACDALTEFMPSLAAEEVLDAWENDAMDRSPKSKFYDR